jgi:1,4-dihydroxy-2-naphthoyl-CoA hydrolase
MSEEPFEYHYVLPLHEVDAAGIAFFSHAFRHAHDAYEAFMDELGLSLKELLSEGEYGLPLVHCEADFLAPIRHGDHVRIELRVQTLGRSSFSLAYRFTSLAGDPLVRALTRHVLVSNQTGRAAALPQAMRRRLQAHSAPDPE